MTGPQLLAVRYAVINRLVGTVLPLSPSQMLVMTPAAVFASTETHAPEKKRTTTIVAKFFANACGIRKRRKRRYVPRNGNRVPKSSMIGNSSNTDSAPPSDHDVVGQYEFGKFSSEMLKYADVCSWATVIMVPLRLAIKVARMASAVIRHFLRKLKLNGLLGSFAREVSPLGDDDGDCEGEGESAATAGQLVSCLV